LLKLEVEAAIKRLPQNKDACNLRLPSQDNVQPRRTDYD
jgi:hypothetical protein